MLVGRVINTDDPWCYPYSSPSPSPIGVNSATKYAKAYALMVVLGRYYASNSLSLMAQMTVLPVASRLFIGFFSGLFVRTIMV